MKKIIFYFLVCLFFSGTVKADPIGDFFKELVDWTFQQNIGGTYLLDLDNRTSQSGAKWNLFTSKHNWLYAGLVASDQPSLGPGITLNIGKAIEKIKGTPLVYLKHLEVGYAYTFSLLDSKNEDYLVVNVIKFEF